MAEFVCQKRFQIVQALSLRGCQRGWRDKDGVAVVVEKRVRIENLAGEGWESRNQPKCCISCATRSGRNNRARCCVAVSDVVYAPGYAGAQTARPGNICCEELGTASRNYCPGRRNGYRDVVL